MLAYTNGKIYTGTTVENNKAILVERGIIKDVVYADQISAEFEITDLNGSNIAPSFIDMQIYGGNGKMFSHELNAESLQSTYDYCRTGGCGHFMITMATNTIDNFLKGIDAVRNYWDKGGKGLLGLHLEGPYLNPVKKGAHKEEWIKKPTAQEVSMLLEKGKEVIKMITIAPEMCDEKIIDQLLQQNIIVSAGHSNATCNQATKAFNQGIPAATHLFNAMSAFQSREPGMVGAIYDHPKVISSVVCDGVHVDYTAIRISKRILNDRLFFITDAVTEVKEGPYHHLYKGDRYTLPDGTLSGSCLTMMQCVKNGVQHVGISLEESLRMASTHPARLLDKADTIGKIEKGYAASFVVFDDALSLQSIICN